MIKMEHESSTECLASFILEASGSLNLMWRWMRRSSAGSTPIGLIRE